MCAYAQVVWKRPVLIGACAVNRMNMVFTQYLQEAQMFGSGKG